MSAVAVVTDTTHYLPPDVAAREELHEVSLHVNWPDGTSERESAMAGFDAFYARLDAAQELPTTSQPSIGDFLEVYEPLAAAGRPIVSLHLSGGLSGTVESARQAAAQLDGADVRVVDSATACGGLAVMLLAATAAARRGADAEEVEARAREIRAASAVYVAIDTLEYLQRGGRIGRAQAMAGSALKLKPIVSVESEMVPLERVRTSGKAFDRLLEHLRTLRDGGADRWAVQHVRAPDRAADMADAARTLFGSEPLFESEIGPVIGTHTGPGLLGVTAAPGALLS